MKSKGRRLFLRGFLISFFMFVFILAAGIVVSRFLMPLLYPRKQQEEWNVKAERPSMIMEASLDDISRNLIYSWDEHDKKIRSLVLEVFHLANHRLSYLTIPLETQITLSDPLYRKLLLANPSMPKMMKLEVLSDYLPEQVLFDYTGIIIGELLDISLSYYTVLPKEKYEMMFVSRLIEEDMEVRPGIIEEEKETAYLGVVREEFTEEFRSEIQTLTTKKDIEEYLEYLYKGIKTNLSLSYKRQYIESYLKVKWEKISFYIVPGENHNSGFYMDHLALKIQLKALLEGN